MARDPRPWWWKARGRWAVQIGRTRHVEPTGIPREDLVGAGRWFESLKEQGPRPAGELTVGDLCLLYLEWDAGRVAADDRDGTSHDRERYKLKRVCKTEVQGDPIGRLRAAKFRRRDYDAAVWVWRSKFSPGYARALATSINGAFAWAVKEEGGRLLDRDPLAGAPLPPEAMVQERYATRDEAAAWLRWLWRNPKIPRPYVLLQRCLIHTGARPSEWTRATVAELDIRNWQLVRGRWKAARRKRKPRRVFVPARLRRSLLRATRGVPGDSPLFPTPRGKTWTHNLLATRTADWRREAIAGGVPIRDEGADRLTAYRWRHTAASDLLMKGVDVATVAELLGTSPHMIHKVYGHLLSDHLAEAAEKLAGRR
jgi:integrase